MTMLKQSLRVYYTYARWQAGHEKDETWLWIENLEYRYDGMTKLPTRFDLFEEAQERVDELNARLTEKFFVVKVTKTELVEAPLILDNG